MSNTNEVFSKDHNIQFTEANVHILKLLTGKNNNEEAIEHFCVTCVENFLLPGDVIKGFVPVSTVKG